jgi:hypothetical protein
MLSVGRSDGPEWQIAVEASRICTSYTAKISQRPAFDTLSVVFLEKIVEEKGNFSDKTRCRSSFFNGVNSTGDTTSCLSGALWYIKLQVGVDWYISLYFGCTLVHNACGEDTCVPRRRMGTCHVCGKFAKKTLMPRRNSR